jgi:Ribosomal protein S21
MISVPSVPGTGFLKACRPCELAALCIVPLPAQEFWCSGEVYFRLAEVRLQEGEALENALRRFKRKVQQEDII